jgi:hypothetical protein
MMIQHLLETEVTGMKTSDMAVYFSHSAEMKGAQLID